MGLVAIQTGILYKITIMDTAHIYQLIKRHATLNNIVLAVAVVIVIASIWNTMDTLQKNFILQQRVNTLEQEIVLTQLEVDTLRLQQQYLQSAEYQELVARDKLGKAAPGENLINLPPLSPEESASAKSQPRSRDDRSNFDKWLDFFFGKR